MVNKKVIIDLLGISVNWLKEKFNARKREKLEENEAINKNKSLGYKWAVEKIFENKPKNKNHLVVVSSWTLVSFFCGMYVGTYFFGGYNLKVSDLATITAVLSAGLVSLIVAEKNKENEINKHREKWCSEVRDCYGALAASISDFSRKSLLGVSEHEKDARKKILKVKENLDNCDEELNSINRYAYIVTLYLLSEKTDDPKRKVLKETRDLRKKISKSASYVFRIAEEVKSKDGQLLPINQRKCEAAIEYLKKTVDNEMLKLSFLVKVYLDSQWREISKGYREYNKVSLVLHLSLLFLITMFVSFVWSTGVNIEAPSGLNN